MSLVLSLIAFLLLTAGTALFVAAEFSLTALERSTVDTNAKNGGWRDAYVQKAHKSLSFQLSGRSSASRSPRWPPVTWPNPSSRPCCARRCRQFGCPRP